MIPPQAPFAGKRKYSTALRSQLVSLALCAPCLCFTTPTRIDYLCNTGRDALQPTSNAST
jgi:hypothetical protein